MPVENIHIIRKQYLHVELSGTEKEGFALERNLGELCLSSVFPVIASVLDQYSPPDAHLFFERLDVDVGAISLELLEKDLAELVALEMQRTLREYVPTRVEELENLSSHPQQSLLPLVSHDLQWKTSRQHTLDAFLYFLAKGRLPWSYHLPHGDTLEQAVRKFLFDGPSRDFFISEIRAVLKSPNARIRLMQQFSKEFLADMAVLMAPEIQKTVQSVHDKIATQESGMEQSSLIDQLWQAALVEMSTGTQTLTESQLAKIALAKHDSFSPSALAKLKQLVESEKDFVSRTIPTNEKPIGSEARSKMLLQKTDHVDSRTKLKENTRNDAVDSLASHPFDEAIYIDNAGLVLVHPFLSLLFEAVNVANNGKIIQPDRALSLLHFLGTGQEYAPEHELVLPKILCGLDPEMPAGKCGVLSEDEKSESMALLEAVIRHWSALRNTTAEGLRSSFLLRSGKLTLWNDGGWLLQIESKSYDVLLDQLPWGFSMIRLPWMNKMLHVEWCNV